MKIRKMTASFGALQNNTIEFSPGLNVVYAPNESGKSTWCAFINAILYGVDSSSAQPRHRPSKLKFAPWGGAPMVGTMNVEFEDEEITISRQGPEDAPMRDFSASYTLTGEPVKGVKNLALGEFLLGIPQDVFERNAFIGQGSVPIGASTELEKRIASIVQTGEEGVSFREAQERLKTAQRILRQGDTGRLPEIEFEISAAREGLVSIEEESKKSWELQKAKAQAMEKRDSIADKVAELRKQQRRNSLEKLSSSRNYVKELESECERLKIKVEETEKRLQSGFFGMTDPAASRKKVYGDIMRMEEISKTAKKGGPILLNIIISVALLLAGAALALLFENIYTYVFAALLGVLSLGQGMRTLLIWISRKKAEGSKTEILTKYDCESVDVVKERLRIHEEIYAEYKAELENHLKAVEQLEKAMDEQAQLDADLLQDLDFTSGDGDAAKYARLLAEAESKLRDLREKSSEAQSRQNALGNSDEIRARIVNLSAEYEKLSLEYEAITLALEAMGEIASEIQNRLTPALSHKTAEIFSRLTGSRYDMVVLDKEFNAAAKLIGDNAVHDATLLSIGAIDQLYLAVRLAICELALPEGKTYPLILDDALVKFDDERCRCALELLREMAQVRQIILFTCHSREVQLMRGYPDVHTIG